MRNQFRNAATPNPTVSKTKGLLVRIACMVSVNVGSTPRMCIGNKFDNTKPLTAFPTIINAMTRSARFRPAANTQMPNSNAIKSTSYVVKSGTTRWLVEAPIANSSLTT